MKRSSMPKLIEVYVHPQQAHLDDGDLDPLDTGVAQPKRHIRFAGSGPKVGNVGV